MVIYIYYEETPVFHYVSMVFSVFSGNGNFIYLFHPQLGGSQTFSAALLHFNHRPASCSSRSKSAPSSMAIAMPALPSPCPRIGHNSKWLEETWIEPSTIYNSLYTIPYYTYKQNLQVDDAIYIRFRFVPGLMTWASKHLTLINGEPLELTFKIQTCK